MIVGADTADDATILHRANSLYKSYRLKRVYYSAFSPIPDTSSQLPLQPPPLMREHRLYQADWLLRFYGFSLEELTYRPENSQQTGMLALDKDPKLAWALAHRELFPVDLNRADYETILRVPGIGVINARRLVKQRRIRALRFTDLQRLRLPTKKVAPFVTVLDHKPAGHQLDSEQLAARFSSAADKQLSLF